MQTKQLALELNQLLLIERYKDYCPNGLQIEGKEIINKIISGVSLNQELIDYAITQNAQAIIVHHGIFWNKSPYPITGVKYQRISKLIKNDINLFAYHLPLDNHESLGNNIQLAKLLGIQPLYTTGEQGLIWVGELAITLSISEFSSLYLEKTGHRPLWFGDPTRKIKKVAWCTGGADSMFETICETDIDLFLTGEIKEPIKHLAEESGTIFVAGGHYVTERYGIKALTSYINDNIGIATEFVEIYNPI